MKRFIKAILPISIISVALFYSCIEDQFDTPPINELPVGSVLTIQGLRDLCPPGTAFKFHGDTSVYAVVTMDEKSGNIYKNAFVQDATGAVNLRFQSSSALYEGDSIRLYLKNAKLSWYNGLFQVDSLHPDSSVVKQATGRDLEPEIVPLSEISNFALAKDYWQSKLVKLENVQILAEDTSKTWADPINLDYGSVTLEDTLGNSVAIRTSGYAKFAGNNVPNGFGSVTAIVSLYEGGPQPVQLLIRRDSEVELNGERWSDSSVTPPTGSGTFEDPYNVASAVQNNTGSNKWVKGYIVGVIETNVDPFVNSFEGPFTTSSNILIADTPDEVSVTKCLTVQLPAGSIRDALNLVDNSDNKSKEVMVMGSLESYFGQPGIKNLVGYWIDGNGIIPEPGFWEEDFSSNLGSFTAYSNSGDQVWEWANYDSGCAVITGYDGGNNYANEDWLVSPAIDLTGRSNVKMSIREAINYINSETGLNDMQILLSLDYEGGDPTASGTWTALSGFNRPAGNSWSFVESGDIDMSAYDGETIYIAFKYLSNSTKAATWEVGKLMFREGAAK